MTNDKTLIPKKIESVEYFDSRFYKLYFGKNINQNAISHIPKVWTAVDSEYFYIYPISVTTVIGYSNPNPELARARGDMGNYEMDRRMEHGALRGSIVHDLAALYQRGGQLIYPDTYNLRTPDETASFAKQRKIDLYGVIPNQETHILMNRFHRVFTKLNPTVRAIEEVVYSLKKDLVYAGRMDGIWELKGGIYQGITRTPLKLKGGKYVMDIKSGVFFNNKEHFMQTSAYRFAYNDDITGCILIHLNSKSKSGIYGVNVFVIEGNELGQYYKKFQNCYEVFLDDKVRVKDPIEPIKLELEGIIHNPNVVYKENRVSLQIKDESKKKKAQSKKTAKKLTKKSPKKKVVKKAQPKKKNFPTLFDKAN